MIKDFVLNTKKMVSHGGGFYTYKKKALCVAIGREKLGARVKAELETLSFKEEMLMYDSGDNVLFWQRDGPVTEKSTSYSHTGKK